MSEDKLKITGVLSQGYGLIPKMLMRDKELSIEAKGIYAYISSYAGNGTTAFPSIGLICSDLGISEKRFYSHKKVLEERGYILVEQERGPKGTFNRNVYTINSVLIPKETQHEVEPNSQNDYTADGSPYGRKPHSDERHSDERHSDERHSDDVGTNNNSINNNSINNNSITNNNNIKEKEDVVDVRSIHEFYQSNFGIEPPFVAQSLNMWVEDLNIELVMHALELTVIAEANQPYKYANSIMVDWAKRKYTTVEQVEAAELTRSRQNQNKPSFYGNRNNKVEQLPDWAKNEQKDVPEVMVDLETQKKFAERLAKYRQGG